MKKVIFFALIILFGLSVRVSFAQILLPFGGKIITAPTPGVSCPAGRQPGSPFTLAPNTPTAVGPFVGDYHPISLNYQLVPGAWILGLYNAAPIPECATQSVPPAPVSGFRTIIHGTSVKVVN